MKKKPRYNHLYEGDCIEIMKGWSDGCIDHCIVDPPYNMSNKRGLAWAFSSHVTMSEAWDRFSREEYLEFSRAWLGEVTRVVRPNGNIFVFGSYHNIYDIGSVIAEMGLRVVNSIVWFKPNAQPNITGRMLTESTEYVIWACNAPEKKAKNWVFNYDVAKRLNGGKQMRNMWALPYTSKKEKTQGKHPAQKAVSVIARLIMIATKPKEVILDCFGGSGTTGVVAQHLDRKWIMIENQAQYIELSKRRLDAPLELPPEILEEFSKKK